MRTRCNGSTRATVRARRIGKRRKALRACGWKDRLRCLRGALHVGNGLVGARGEARCAGGRKGGLRAQAGGRGGQVSYSNSPARTKCPLGISARAELRARPTRPALLGAASNDTRREREGSAELGDRQGHGRRTMRAVIAKSVYRARKEFEPIQAADPILTDPPRARGAGRSSGHDRERNDHRSMRGMRSEQGSVADRAPPTRQGREAHEAKQAVTIRSISQRGPLWCPRLPRLWAKRPCGRAAPKTRGKIGCQRGPQRQLVADLLCKSATRKR